MRRLLAPLLVVMILLAACGGDSEEDPTTQAVLTGGDDPTAPAGGGIGDTMPSPGGPPITVAEALEMGAGESFIIAGYLFVRDDGTVVIADEIAESFPPQPSGAQVTVTGFDPQTLPLVEGPADAEIAITAWTEQPVELFGSISDGVFVGNTLAAS